ncbi:hypothetical protein CONLIGDRAFT_681633 [Coniochaeta ligniaria NRRL 30616]|uniref:Extracellular membrane protein CFEM domain-containing protein n=1 Tax=Coniochaeta ligniaria NRRL 30616 TaxID=1408157 RepID=A0A1J7J5X1_9PEZI|nr:hypothetical protein CONLIGDRAFT_681633 [Coniochaeta ligniaria NRRL 30616]
MKHKTRMTATVAWLSCAGCALAAVITNTVGEGTIDSVIIVDDSIIDRHHCKSSACLSALEADPDAASSFCSTLAASDSFAMATNPFEECEDAKKAIFHSVLDDVFLNVFLGAFLNAFLNSFLNIFLDVSHAYSHVPATGHGPMYYRQL